jgi:YfiH family protein
MASNFQRYSLLDRGRSVHYFTFLLFSREDLVHGVFHRWGGVSSGALSNLNVGLFVGDDEKRVMENRDRIKKALCVRVLASAKQIHGDRVKVVGDVANDIEYGEYDALVTNSPSVGLMIQQADCQAVMLHDPVKNIVANIHSGWRGSVQNIIGKTISKMQDVYDSDPRNIRAAISPSLGPCCAEFTNYSSELPKSFHKFHVGDQRFDFWAISRAQLCEAGLLPENIEVAGICTACDTNYFSYRREGRTGRFASVIALNSP